MSKGLPATISVTRLAKQERELVGTVPVAKMPRLLGALASDLGSVEVSAAFSRDKRRFYRLDISIKAEVALLCQRCMEPVTLSFTPQAVLGVIESEGMAERLPDEVEPLLVADLEQLELLPTIEDELILALPQIAKHELGECRIEMMQTEPQEVAVVETEKENPFSVLADLKLEK